MKKTTKSSSKVARQAAGGRDAPSQAPAFDPNELPMPVLPLWNDEEMAQEKVYATLSGVGMKDADSFGGKQTARGGWEDPEPVNLPPCLSRLVAGWRRPYEVIGAEDPKDQSAAPVVVHLAAPMPGDSDSDTSAGTAAVASAGASGGASSAGVGGPGGLGGGLKSKKLSKKEKQRERDREREKGKGHTDKREDDAADPEHSTLTDSEDGEELRELDKHEDLDDPWAFRQLDRALLVRHLVDKDGKPLNEDDPAVHLLRWIASQMMFIGDNRDVFEEKDYLWQLIFPHTRTGVPQYNPSGKYAVRLFVHGRWRKVFVDDRIPVDVKGTPVLVTTSDIRQLWPMLLTKALLKVGNGYTGVEDVVWIHWMTGWLPESTALKRATAWTICQGSLNSRVILPHNTKVRKAKTKERQRVDQEREEQRQAEQAAAAAAAALAAEQEKEKEEMRPVSSRHDGPGAGKHGTKTPSHRRPSSRGGDRAHTQSKADHNKGHADKAPGGTTDGRDKSQTQGGAGPAASDATTTPAAVEPIKIPHPAVNSVSHCLAAVTQPVDTLTEAQLEKLNGVGLIPGVAYPLVTVAEGRGRKMVCLQTPIGVSTGIVGFDGGDSDDDEDAEADIRGGSGVSLQQLSVSLDDAQGWSGRFSVQDKKSWLPSLESDLNTTLQREEALVMNRLKRSAWLNAQRPALHANVGRPCTFWMLYDDFCHFFSRLLVVRHPGYGLPYRMTLTDLWEDQEAVFHPAPSKLLYIPAPAAAKGSTGSPGSPRRNQELSFLSEHTPRGVSLYVVVHAALEAVPGHHHQQAAAVRLDAYDWATGAQNAGTMLSLTTGRTAVGKLYIGAPPPAPPSAPSTDGAAPPASAKSHHLCALHMPSRRGCIVEIFSDVPLTAPPEALESSPTQREDGGASAVSLKGPTERPSTRGTSTDSPRRDAGHRSGRKDDDGQDGQQDGDRHHTAGQKGGKRGGADASDRRKGGQRTGRKGHGRSEADLSARAQATAERELSARDRSPRRSSSPRPQMRPATNRQYTCVDFMKHPEVAHLDPPLPFSYGIEYTLIGGPRMIDGERLPNPKMSRFRGKSPSRSRSSSTSSVGGGSHYVPLKAGTNGPVPIAMPGEDRAMSNLSPRSLGLGAIAFVRPRQNSISGMASPRWATALQPGADGKGAGGLGSTPPLIPSPSAVPWVDVGEAAQILKDHLHVKLLEVAGEAAPSQHSPDKSWAPWGIFSLNVSAPGRPTPVSIECVPDGGLALASLRMVLVCNATMRTWRAVAVPGSLGDPVLLQDSASGSIPHHTKDKDADAESGAVAADGEATAGAKDDDKTKADVPWTVVNWLNDSGKVVIPAQALPPSPAGYTLFVDTATAVYPSRRALDAPPESDADKKVENEKEDGKENVDGLQDSKEKDGEDIKSESEAGAEDEAAEAVKLQRTLDAYKMEIVEDKETDSPAPVKADAFELKLPPPSRSATAQLQSLQAPVDRFTIRVLHDASPGASMVSLDPYVFQGIVEMDGLATPTPRDQVLFRYNIKVKEDVHCAVRLIIKNHPLLCLNHVALDLLDGDACVASTSVHLKQAGYNNRGEVNDDDIAEDKTPHSGSRRGQRGSERPPSSARAHTPVSAPKDKDKDVEAGPPAPAPSAAAEDDGTEAATAVSKASVAPEAQPVAPDAEQQAAEAEDGPKLVVQQHGALESIMDGCMSATLTAVILEPSEREVGKKGKTVVQKHYLLQGRAVIDQGEWERLTQAVARVKTDTEALLAEQAKAGDLPHQDAATPGSGAVAGQAGAMVHVDSQTSLPEPKVVPEESTDSHRVSPAVPQPSSRDERASASGPVKKLRSKRDPLEAPGRAAGRARGGSFSRQGGRDRPSTTAGRESKDKDVTPAPAVMTPAAPSGSGKAEHSDADDTAAPQAGHGAAAGTGAGAEESNLRTKRTKLPDPGQPGHCFINGHHYAFGPEHVPWKVVVAAFRGPLPELRRDTEEADRHADIKAQWEKNEPGRAKRAAAARERFFVEAHVLAQTTAQKNRYSPLDAAALALTAAHYPESMPTITQLAQSGRGSLATDGDPLAEISIKPEPHDGERQHRGKDAGGESAREKPSRAKKGDGHGRGEGKKGDRVSRASGSSASGLSGAHPGLDAVHGSPRDRAGARPPSSGGRPPQPGGVGGGDAVSTRGLLVHTSNSEPLGALARDVHLAIPKDPIVKAGQDPVLRTPEFLQAREVERQARREAMAQHQQTLQDAREEDDRAREALMGDLFSELSTWRNDVHQTMAERAAARDECRAELVAATTTQVATAQQEREHREIRVRAYRLAAVQQTLLSEGVTLPVSPEGLGDTGLDNPEGEELVAHMMELQNSLIGPDGQPVEAARAALGATTATSTSPAAPTAPKAQGGGSAPLPSAADTLPPPDAASTGHEHRRPSPAHGRPSNVPGLALGKTHGHDTKAGASAAAGEKKVSARRGKHDKRGKSRDGHGHARKSVVG